MSVPSTVSESLPGPRVMPRLMPAMGGVLRLTWGQHWTLRNIVWTVLIVTGLGVISYLMGSRGENYEMWINEVLLTMGVPILAFEAGARAMRDDLKPGTVDYVVTRAVPRWAYAIFKYISQWLVTVTAGSLALAVMLVIGFVLEVPQEAAGRQFLVLIAGASAFQALGFFLGSLTSRYILLGLLYAGIVEAAVGNIPLQLNNLSILRHLWALLGYGGPLQSTLSMGQELGLVLAITAGLMAVAVLVFSRREFIGKKAEEG